ncbi:MAG: tetratricopeptide repeat protein, partial [Anaerolineae bacterium]|nr:tetratricopeptide repeat protein [Anaerolineae bacterium]
KKSVRAGVQRAGAANPQSYFEELQHSSTESALWKQLINLLTIGETYFFRDRSQFAALRNHILPALIRERREQKMRILRLWSAGCSTGEEAYSLAILLHELINDLPQWHITLLATDINEESLARARRGTFGNWSFRIETPPDLREKYFASQRDQHALLPHLRQMVTFSYLNLVEGRYPAVETDTTNIDLIICRNVTIYFDRPTTRSIVERFHAALVSGGWLVVGHAEPLQALYQPFEPHTFTDTLIYRKPLPRTAEPTPSQHQALAEVPPRAVAVSSTAGGLHRTNLNITDLEPPQNPIEEVYRLLKRGQTDDARQVLIHLLQNNPQHMDGLFLLAKVEADQGKTEGVHEILDTIDALNPLVPQAHYLRALLHQQSQSWEDAKAALRRALYADRHFVMAHYYMGELLYTEGNLTHARRFWRNAADLLAGMEPDSPLPYGDDTRAGTLYHAIQQRLKRL